MARHDQTPVYCCIKKFDNAKTTLNLRTQRLPELHARTFRFCFDLYRMRQYTVFDRHHIDRFEHCCNNFLDSRNRSCLADNCNQHIDGQYVTVAPAPYSIDAVRSQPIILSNAYHPSPRHNLAPAKYRTLAFAESPARRAAKKMMF